MLKQIRYELLRVIVMAIISIGVVFLYSVLENPDNLDWPFWWSPWDQENSSEDQPTQKPSSSTDQTSSSGWQPMDACETYTAPTFGFVSAFSGGDNPPGNVWILEGPPGNSPLEVRTRFNKYDGEVIPVFEGHRWKVAPNKGGETTCSDSVKKSIVVQWLGRNS